MKVFISYSYEDSTFAKGLEDFLKHSGLDIIDAADGILPGDNIIASINRSINTADFFVLIISNASNENQLYATEIGLIVSKIISNTHKKILPILRDKDAIIPPFINHYQALYLPNKKEDNYNFELVKSVLLLKHEDDEELSSRDLQAESDLILYQEELLKRAEISYKKSIAEHTKAFSSSLMSAAVAAITSLATLLLGVFALSSGLKETKGTLYSIHEHMQLDGISSVVSISLALFIGIAIGALGSLFLIQLKKK